MADKTATQTPNELRWKVVEWDGERGCKKVKVVTQPMTQAEARELFPYRPASKYSESHFGGNSLADDIAMLLNGIAKRCKMCKAPTKKEYLTDEVCPDCCGWAEYSGINPYKPR
ncbi:MAG: hypothetical protein Q8O98_00815 [bacterium]|nr:hypothetical protein [bacterium]